MLDLLTESTVHPESTTPATTSSTTAKPINVISVLQRDRAVQPSSSTLTVTQPLTQPQPIQKRQQRLQDHQQYQQHQVVDDNQSTTISYSFFPVVDQLLRAEDNQYNQDNKSLSCSTTSSAVPASERLDAETVKISENFTNRSGITHFTERSSLDSGNSREHVFSTPPVEIPAGLANDTFPPEKTECRNECRNESHNDITPAARTDSKMDMNKQQSNHNKDDAVILPNDTDNAEHDKPPSDNSVTHSQWEDQFQSIGTFVDSRIWIALFSCTFQILWSCMTTSQNDLDYGTYWKLQIIYYIFTISTSTWLLILYLPVGVLRAIMIKLKLCSQTTLWQGLQYYCCCCDEEMLPPWQREARDREPSRIHSRVSPFSLFCQSCKHSCTEFRRSTCTCCRHETRYSRLPQHDLDDLANNNEAADSSLFGRCCSSINQCETCRDRLLLWYEHCVDEKFCTIMSVWVVLVFAVEFTLFYMLPPDAIEVSFHTHATFGTISQMLSTRIPISKWTIFATFFATPCVCAWIALRNLIYRCYHKFEIWYPS